MTTPPAHGVTVQPTADQLKAAFIADLFPDQYGNLHGGFDLGEPLVARASGSTPGASGWTSLKRVLYWARRIDAAQVAEPDPDDRAASRPIPSRDPDTADPVGPMSDARRRRRRSRSRPAASPGSSRRPRTPSPYETTVLDATTHLAVPLTVAARDAALRLLRDRRHVRARPHLQRAAARLRGDRPPRVAVLGPDRRAMLPVDPASGLTWSRSGWWCATIAAASRGSSARCPVIVVPPRLCSGASGAA